MNLLGRVAVVSGITFTALHSPLLVVCFGIMFLLVYVGLALPAVFLKDKGRRKDARAALRVVLQFFRH